MVVVPGPVDRRELATERLVPFSVPAPAPNAKAGPPPAEPVAAGWVIVMSVPTPYTDCSALACADLTPEETDVTTMTRAIARAIPIAMMMVCLRLLSSSLRK
jgi:hypothetical protein